MSRATPAVLSRTLGYAKEELQLRKRNARRLLRCIDRSGGYEGVRFPEGAEPGYLRLPALREEARVQDTVTAEKLGIMPAYPRALCDVPDFAEGVGNADTDFVGARKLARCLMTFPTHSRLLERDLVALERWIVQSPSGEN